MPIWLRRFTYNTINDYYLKEEEAYNKATNKAQTVTGNKPIAKPNIPDLTNIKPSYTSKVSRK